MAIGAASAIAGAGALASAFGGSKKQTTSENLSGYQALPKEVQDLLIEQYLPKAQATLNMPYQNIPMQRAQNPAGDQFASQALYDLQNFSDAAGGYFTPYNQGGNGTVNMASYQGAAGAGAAQPMQQPDNGGGMSAGGDMALANMYLENMAGQGSRNGSYMAKEMLKSGQLTAADIIKVMNGSQIPSSPLSSPLMDFITQKNRNSGR